jgi:hypothetical protein
MYEQEAYCNMLVKYREELTRPVDEAMDFLKRVEAQLDSISGAAAAGKNLLQPLFISRTWSYGGRVFFITIYMLAALGLPHWEMVVLDSGSGCSGSCHSELAWHLNLIID